MLGQSLSCQVIKAIANTIAATFMKQAFNKVSESMKSVKEKAENAISIATNGQLELVF
ncbi:hypothetical protein ACOI1C_14715 [Bacillus sp. DJP31]|uniref:hypothetical protein n=1 Tax=Bacillus sp. DJP31 TaxID=3409789 RepID=UPI003BB72E7A